jgi:hypothetical protein
MAALEFRDTLGRRSRWSAAGLGPGIQNYETGLASGVVFNFADRSWGSLVNLLLLHSGCFSAVSTVHFLFC